jgi:S-formylglutathione hydrolase
VSAGRQPLILGQQAGYDHSYFFIAFFIATFVGDHIRHHAEALR